jgi:thiamine pyrophosphate-dependent acetolactate synthase large subunit-like protein
VNNMSTVADQFAETLATAGVKRIYCIVGGSLNGLTDAVRRQAKIEWVHVRHKVAAVAAGAEAHLTGALAIPVCSCGPGTCISLTACSCHRSLRLLDFVALERKSTGFLTYETEFSNPDFAAMAPAISVRGIHLTDPSDVDDGIANALAHDGPALVDAVVARTELAMPPAGTVETANGSGPTRSRSISRRCKQNMVRTATSRPCNRDLDLSRRDRRNTSGEPSNCASSSVSFSLAI